MKIIDIKPNDIIKSLPSEGIILPITLNKNNNNNNNNDN